MSEGCKVITAGRSQSRKRGGIVQLRSANSPLPNRVPWARLASPIAASANGWAARLRWNRRMTRAKLRTAKADEERELCTRVVEMKRLAVTANKNLHDAFKAASK